MFKFNRKEKGQGLVEYALILVLIAIVVIVAMTTLGGQVSGTFDEVNSGLAGDGGETGDESAPTASLGPKEWGNPAHVYSLDEACAAAGISSGETAYLWGESASMSNGQAFYWTNSSAAPVTGYSLLSSGNCS